MLSILAAEFYSIAHWFDIGIVIKSTLGKILGAAILLILDKDSKSLYNCLIKLSII